MLTARDLSYADAILQTLVTTDRQSYQHASFADGTIGDFLNLFVEYVYRRLRQNYHHTYDKSYRNDEPMRLSGEFRTDFVTDRHKTHRHGGQKDYKSYKCVQQTDGNTL